MEKQTEEYLAFANRMFNWKFGQAEAAMPEDIEDDQRRVVEALAAVFGDCGWFDGRMGTIVDAAVELLIGTAIEEEERHWTGKHNVARIEDDHYVCECGRRGGPVKPGDPPLEKLKSAL